MSVWELKNACGLQPLVGDEAAMNTEVSGCYIGDLLSWAMSRAGEHEAWITVMGNVNAVAVAVLAECACIILCDRAPLDDDARARAEQQGVVVLQSEEHAYALALKIGACLSAGK